jgi:hypothetical protein
LRVTNLTIDYTLNLYLQKMIANPLFWTSEDVTEWLTTINLSSVSGNFRSHSISGEDLLTLTNKEIREDLNIARVHDRKYLLRAIDEL